MILALSALLSALLYGAGVRAVACRGPRRWQAWRAAAFVAGLAVLLLALLSPLHAGAEQTLSAHMIQHLLITLGAAPLLVLGAPVALALRALRGSARHDLGRLVASRPARWLVHPAAGWLALALGTGLTHLTGFYESALRHEAVHEVEHVVFLVTAILWWTSLVGVHPGHAGPGAIGRLSWAMAAMPIMAGVGAWLAESETVRYAAYAGSGALADQREAGSLMWAIGTLPMALAAVALAVEALWREERRQRRREAVRA